MGHLDQLIAMSKEEKFRALDAAGVTTVRSPAEMGSAMKLRLGG